MDYASGIEFLLEHDAVFKKLYENLGFLEQRKRRVSFASFVVTIVGQQLSGKAAEAIYKRLLTVVDQELLPDKILTLDSCVLRKIGLSRAKGLYIQSLAQKFVDNEIVLKEWKLCTDAELYKKLLSIKGIGPWSAKIIMLFNFGRLDAFPYGDASLERAFSIITGRELSNLPKFVDNWSPYSGIVAMYMWSYIDTNLD